MFIVDNYREWANGIGDVILDWARNGQNSDATKVHDEPTAVMMYVCVPVLEGLLQDSQDRDQMGEHSS